MRSKYNARKTTIDGHTFDSKKEAERYLELRSKQKRGEISELTLQPEFTLIEGFTDNQGKKIRPMKYRADFGYTEKGIPTIEDVKGILTAVYRIKKKLLLNQLKDSEIIFRET